MVGILILNTNIYNKITGFLYLTLLLSQQEFGFINSDYYRYTVDLSQV